MTPEATISKAIEKAQANGWDVSQSYPDGKIPSYQFTTLNVPVVGIIFSHGFAKALWGEESYDALRRQRHAGFLWHERYPLFPFWGGPDDEGFDGPMWQYHLQRMVIADDPIAYLAENL